MIAAAWLGAALAVLALVFTAINVVSWPRGRREAALAGRVSVLIPARNEAHHIEATVAAALGSRHPVHEVRVYDDRSSDGTGDRVRAMGDDRVTVHDGVPLPAGWVGKPHGCHRLAEAATGDLLLFVDADTVLDPGGIGRIVALLQDLDADLVTAVPRQITGSLAERVLLPLLHLTYTSWLPLALIHRVADPRVLAANGQVLAVRRAAYDRIGGFAAVAADVVDDMAFCRAAKAEGLRVVFADGDAVARCRMYRSLGEVWRGFSKNVYEGLGHPVALLAALALYGLAFVAPWLALIVAVVLPGLLVPALVGVGANVLQRTILALRHGHRPIAVLLHPVAVLVLMAVALNSWRWSRNGRITWAGRTYAARALRGAGR